MPPTPFLGLSLFIHTIIIFLHKVFHWTPRKNLVHRKASIFVNVVSIFVMTIVFWLVVATALILLYTSIQEKHSIFY
jgi:uncharacterized membrane protein YdbT with pleckstrin-like domain